MGLYAWTNSDHNATIYSDTLTPQATGRFYLGPWYDSDGNDISDKLNTDYSAISYVDSSAVYWTSGGNGDTIPPTSIEAGERSEYDYYRDPSKDIIYVSKFSDGTTTYKLKDDKARNDLFNKQDMLISGTNIKTVNNTSLLGSGNIPFPTVDQTYDGTSANAQSGVAVKSAIDSAISSVYKPAGSIAFTSLPTPSSSILGNVYNMTDSFTTDSRFVEGSGKSYPAGTNVVIINSTGVKNTTYYAYTDTFPPNPITYYLLNSIPSVGDYIYSIKNGVATKTKASVTEVSNNQITGIAEPMSVYPVYSPIPRYPANDVTVREAYDGYFFDVLAGMVDLSGYATTNSLANVATSGSYNDLSNKPDLSVYALDNAVVHLSGNETINGDKLFKGQAQFTAGIGISFKTSADDEYYVMRSSGAPSAGCGLFLNNSVSKAAFKAETNKITIGSGTILPNSVTPATSDSSTRIATTAYVKSNLSNYVSLKGNETIGGTKTFVVDPYIKNPTPQLYISDTQQTKGTAPSADVWGGIAFQDANGNVMGRCRQIYNSNKMNRVELQVYKANSSSDTTAASLGIKYPASGNPYVETGAYFRPSSDNSLNLGDSSHRWKQLYAGTTTISTSDERLKQDIENISDEILDVWGKVEFYRYKFKDAVAEKGENARYHTGLIAQRIERIFAEHGLNAFDYGLLCYDEWQEQKEEKDEEGNIITPKIEAGNRYSLRYEECLCMEAAYQRRRADRFEERLRALENKLGI